MDAYTVDVDGYRIPLWRNNADLLVFELIGACHVPQVWLDCTCIRNVVVFVYVCCHCFPSLYAQNNSEGTTV